MAEEKTMSKGDGIEEEHFGLLNCVLRTTGSHTFTNQISTYKWHDAPEC